MEVQKSFKKKAGLTLMELVIAIIVAIALGSGAVVIYQELKNNAKAANKADLSAKVAGAIAIYLGANNATLPTGNTITTGDIMQNAQCTGSGLIQLKSNTSISVQLLNEAGTEVDTCNAAVYGVSA